LRSFVAKSSPIHLAFPFSKVGYKSAEVIVELVFPL
jgi:hypothetical protein